MIESIQASTPTLTLASGSPRRRELLGLLGLPFAVKVAGIPETPAPAEGPLDYVRRVATEKAQATSATLNAGLVLAADTEVILDGQVLGKPSTPADAEAMLEKLRGRTHEVVSVLVLQDAATGKAERVECHSPVPMRNYTPAEVAAYIASGDPFDKAGGYAIQHAGFHPVEGFAHCYAGVMGLPLCHLTLALRRRGLEPPVNVPDACQTFNEYECPVFQSILAGQAGGIAEA
jgi:septum formation protein